ncbi:hypothetical protein BDZ90DRAFT_123379 [Jaminaea rosea]|uniref:Uncharacterized protein n=1 Tax=Jaminaea rosea TaxID=1569628 RepID=A0A316UHN7_9BASI|nr:hypothetical protein BDZ90DRAFT_123379 [Jaminaea rosea]PWN24408.1 hypothetical protein BDZ90DRAFT_123379 [Jaminaea rosea]
MLEHVSPTTAHLQRATRFQPTAWYRRLQQEGDVRERVERAAQQAMDKATPVGRAIWDVLDHGDPEDLKSLDWWQQFWHLSCNANFAKGKDARKMGAAVYIFVGFKQRRLSAVYGGRTGWQDFRCVEHMTDLILNKNGCKVHRVIRECDSFAIFNVFEDTSAHADTAEGWADRASIEPIWAHIIGGFNEDEAFVSARRKYGLPAWSGVVGCNRTRCFEAPEGQRGGSDYMGIIRDRDIKQMIVRKKRYCRRMVNATAKQRGTARAKWVVLFNATRDIEQATLHQRLWDTGLHIVPRSSQSRLLCGLYLNVRMARLLQEKDGTFLEWSLFLGIGQGSSLPFLSPYDAALFEDVALIAVRDGRVVVLTWKHAPLPPSVRRGFNEVFTLLPYDLAQPRIAAHLSVAQALDQTLPPPGQWDKLSDLDKMAFLGLFFVAGSGHLRMGRYVLPTMTRGCKREGEKLEALRRFTGHYNASMGEYSAASILFAADRGDDNSHPAVDMDRKSSRPRRNWRLLIRDKASPTGWAPFPYALDPGPDRPEGRLICVWLEVFRHIDRHVGGAQPDIPLLFLPKSCPLEMSGRRSDRATKGLHQYKPGFIRLTRSCANAPRQDSAPYTLQRRRSGAVDGRQVEEDVRQSPSVECWFRSAQGEGPEDAGEANGRRHALAGQAGLGGGLSRSRKGHAAYQTAASSRPDRRLHLGGRREGGRNAPRVGGGRRASGRSGRQ